jgi:hypothetical protein
VTRARNRDRELGALLGELPVPEHRPDFFQRLDRSLAPELQRTRRHRRLRRGRPVLALAGTAALAALLLVLALGLPDSSAPEQARAAEVRAAVRQAFARLRTLRGTLAYRSFHPNPVFGRVRTQRWSFALTSAGDMRLDELGGPNAVTFDAATGNERQLAESASLGRGAFPIERTGVAPGPPDRGPSEQLLERSLGAAVRSLFAAHRLQIRETTYRARDVWRVALPLRPVSTIATADRLEIAIDRQTKLPLQVRLSAGGRVLNELRIGELTVNRPLPRRTFRLTFPRHAQVARADEGFRRTSLPRVRDSVGYSPLVPQWLPRGFRLAEVAVAERAARTGRGPRLNPPSRMVASLSYRRGFDRLTITMRLRGSGGRSWRDPFVGLNPTVSARRFEIPGGALRGREAHVVTEPLALPHLWTLTDELVVTISGDVGRDALLRTAASLELR